MNKNCFESSKSIRWCPGCGNYAILMAVEKALFSVGFSSDNVVFVSGIGCSGRFPYYINSHGFHTLHGRAPAVATGLKMVRDDLNVWVVVGDGDGFSIGLSHMLHMIRRNVSVNVLFINNKIYALTKGQYSPTSEKYSISKSSPYGSLENPINPVLLALTVGATFVARAIDNDSERLKLILIEASKHKGLAFIEVLQNCSVFNNGIFDSFKERDDKNNKLLFLKDNDYLVFGKNNEYALDLDENFKLRVVKNVNDNKNIMLKYKVFDENILQILLAKQSFIDSPFPVGIFRNFEKDTYEMLYKKQLNSHKAVSSISELFNEL
ncbi:MAG TPA: 2-oxoacid:ferredoxin oxidoreductase subunit beta [Candidatus Azoamicus sp. OHIO1]